MKRYLAKLVFRIVNQSTQYQFEEQIRLIEAESEPKALNLAIAIGREVEEDFRDIHQNAVSWKFLSVTGFYPITEIKHGTELYSRIFESKEGELLELDYLNYGKHLQSQYLNLTTH